MAAVLPPSRQDFWEGLRDTVVPTRDRLGDASAAPVGSASAVSAVREIARGGTGVSPRRRGSSRPSPSDSPLPSTIRFGFYPATKPLTTTRCKGFDTNRSPPYAPHSGNQTFPETSLPRILVISPLYN